MLFATTADFSSLTFVHFNIVNKAQIEFPHPMRKKLTNNMEKEDNKSSRQKKK